jgi:hypothetical protein
LRREGYRAFERGEWRVWLKDFSWVEKVEGGDGKEGKGGNRDWESRVEEAEREVGVRRG